MKVIVFDVDHGFCAFVKSPNDFGLMIDCGRKEHFSPIRYVRDREADSLTALKGHQLAKLVVSHPHDDHVQDISNLKKLLSPAILLRQRYDWDSLKDPEAEDEYDNLDEYSTWQATYDRPATDPDWGMSIHIGPYLSVDEAKTLSEKDYVNNSSIPVIVEYADLKIIFPGDLMTSGWETLLKIQSFRRNLEGGYVFVASHHGHKSGFCERIYEVMGKPLINIVSAHRRDESVDTRYSSDDYAHGVTFGNERRRMLSTRKDGSIILEYVRQGWEIRAENMISNDRLKG